MRVILLENVPGTGVRGDLKEVADGYALNYLIPRKLAKFATPQMVEEAHSFKRRKATQQIETSEKLKNTLKTLDGKKIIIKGKTNEQGHLFAQIHENDIMLAITEQHGADTSSLKIELPEPIKHVGSYKVSVSALKLKPSSVEVVVNQED